MSDLFQTSNFDCLEIHSPLSCNEVQYLRKTLICLNLKLTVKSLAPLLKVCYLFSKYLHIYSVYILGVCHQFRDCTISFLKAVKNNQNFKHHQDISKLLVLSCGQNKLMNNYKILEEILKSKALIHFQNEKFRYEFETQQLN